MYKSLSASKTAARASSYLHSSPLQSQDTLQDDMGGWQSTRPSDGPGVLYTPTPTARNTPSSDIQLFLDSSRTLSTSPFGSFDSDAGGTECGMGTSSRIPSRSSSHWDMEATQYMPRLNQYDRAIGDATHDELLRTNNKAYMGLILAKVEIQAEFKVLQMAYNKLAESLAPGQSNRPNPDPSARPVSETPSNIANAPHAPALPLSGPTSHLPPLKRHDYPQIKYWFKQDWMTTKKCASNGVILGGLEDDDDGADNSKNISLQYVQDETGEVISGYRAREIRLTARMIWSQLELSGLAPNVWSEVTQAASTYYRSELYRLYPELRLCDGNWKADLIATKNYSQWHSARAEKKEQSERNAHRKRRAADNDSVRRPLKKVNTRAGSMAASSAPLPVRQPHAARSFPEAHEGALPTGTNIGPDEGAGDPPSICATTTTSLALDSSTMCAGVAVPSESDVAGDQSTFLDDSEGVPGPAIPEHVSPAPREDILPALQLLAEATLSGPTHVHESTVSSPQPDITSTPPPLDTAREDLQLLEKENVPPVAKNIAARDFSIIDPLASDSVPAAQMSRLSNTIKATPTISQALPTGEAVPSGSSSLNKGKDNPAKKPARMRPNNSTTARNLFAKDYVKEHPQVLTTEFAEVWGNLDTETLKRYEDASIAATAARKISALQATSKTG